MDKIKKAPGGASQNSHCEDSESFAVMQRIKQYFLDGGKGTVVDMFIETGVCNPMRIIKSLKEQGWKIKESDLDGMSFYWFDHEQRTQILTELYPD